MFSWFQRLRSSRHRLWFGISERMRWSRGTFCETPALELVPETREQAQRIAALQSRYQVKFELQLSAATSMKNYEYLDILDRAWQGAGLTQPTGADLCDVGCANFWYASALHAFFRPASLLGVDVEGYRRYRDGHTRIDYAQGYVARLPNANFLISDYLRCEMPADVISAWFPFVTPQALLAWRLPLSLLQPEGLFRQIRRNLRVGGQFVMVNHGAAEAAVAANWCVAAGLRRIGSLDTPGVFSGYRLQAAVCTRWQAGS
jgi:SAM-dependent methyltransferase